MAVKIRLARHGAKKHPFYRLVAAAARAPRDGRFIELLGTYDPNKSPGEINFKLDRVDAWINKGAQPTLTVRRLINRARRAAASA